jgi:hypothetical protein
MPGVPVRKCGLRVAVSADKLPSTNIRTHPKQLVAGGLAERSGNALLLLEELYDRVDGRIKLAWLIT